MGLVYKICGTVAVQSTADMLQFWTGLPLHCATEIMRNGFDLQRMTEYSATAKKLHATLDLRIAYTYAHLSLAVDPSATPSVLGFACVAANLR
jgi:hypothetical protein